MLFQKRPQPSEVFTPRSAEVSDMYVPRPELEAALRDGLKGNLHLLIHGESGTGKSWLYKKVFNDLGAAYMVANLANASRLGGIGAELKNLIDRKGMAIKTGYTEEKSAEVTAVVATGAVSHAGEYELGQMEPFERALAGLRRVAGARPAIIVFDNLEAAFTDPLLKELADLVILCDDERYAAYKVKILIVGVPSGVKEYYYKTPHHASVGNRIRELPEVSRLTSNECAALIANGFVRKLGLRIEPDSGVLEHIAWVTDRIPQAVHEYCLEVAKIAVGSGEVTEAICELADIDWMVQSLYHGYSVIEWHMNERNTVAGRRNQVLFSLGLPEGEQFRTNEIELTVRQEFPTSTANTVLNVAQILAELCGGDRPVIRRSPKGDAFRFANPMYRLVLRIMLFKTDDGRVEKRLISAP